MSIYKGTTILKRSRSFGSETKQSGPDRPEGKEISHSKSMFGLRKRKMKEIKLQMNFE
jgi:hypothetical protein